MLLCINSAGDGAGTPGPYDGDMAAQQPQAEL